MILIHDQPVFFNSLVLSEEAENTNFIQVFGLTKARPNS
jgi:hypothetical protein